MTQLKLAASFETPGITALHDLPVAFLSDLLCMKHARFMHCERERGCVRVSFHEHPQFPDDNAATYLLTREAFHRLHRTYAGQLRSMMICAEDGIKIAAAHALEKFETTYSNDNPGIRQVSVASSGPTFFRS